MAIPSPQTPHPAVGAIHPQVLYDLQIVEMQFDLKSAVLRRMRRSGLAVRRVGRKNFIYGQDLIDHVLAKCPIVGPNGDLIDPDAGTRPFV